LRNSIRLIQKDVDLVKMAKMAAILLPDDSAPMAKSKQAIPIVKERRASIRIPASKVIRYWTLRTSTGQEVELVDINVDDGIRIKGRIMLKPGARLRLMLDTPEASYDLGGSVRRCRIVSIKEEEILYEAAVILDEILPLHLNAVLHKVPRKPLFAWLSIGKSVQV
jgi:hypothetical protein